MTFRMYSSADPGAPTLSGTGSIFTVLDAILVDGYGSKAPAGWTKAFTGTGKAAYRMATGAGKSGAYLRIVDQLDSGRGARWRGYESMTDVDTGTNPVPTVAQVSGDGFYCWKSWTNDGTARYWQAWADDSFLVIHFNSGSSDTPLTIPTSIGQLNHIVIGQLDKLISLPYNPFFVFGGITNTTFNSSGGTGLGEVINSTSFASVGGYYASHNYLGMAVSIPIGIRSKGVFSSVDQTNTSLIENPSRLSGRLRMSKAFVFESHPSLGSGACLYTIPCIWRTEGSLPTSMYNSTFQGSNELAGIDFYLGLAGNASSTGYAAFQSSGERL